MNKWMAMAVLCSMSIFAVSVAAAPQGAAKAAKTVFNKINPGAKAMATKRGIDYIRHYDSGDSLDRMCRNHELFRNSGSPYITGPQSDLFIRNPNASQDDRKPVASKNGTDSLSVDRQVKYIDSYQAYNLPPKDSPKIPDSVKNFFEQFDNVRKEDVVQGNRQAKFVNPYLIDPIIARSARLYNDNDDERNRRRVEHDFGFGGIDAFRNQIQKTPQVFIEEPVLDLDHGYSVNFSPKL